MNKVHTVMEMSNGKLFTIFRSVTFFFLMDKWPICNFFVKAEFQIILELLGLTASKREPQSRTCLKSFNHSDNSCITNIYFRTVSFSQQRAHVISLSDKLVNAFLKQDFPIYCIQLYSLLFHHFK